MMMNLMRSGKGGCGVLLVKLATVAVMIVPVVVVVSMSAVSCVGAEQQERLNVLFVAADDLRNDLGCYGHPIVKSPNIDRLARRGILFNRAYCQQAVCNPSRASLLTGRRPDTLKIWDLPTHFREVMPEVITLPQWFKQQGYFTQNIGKIFHNWRQKIRGDPDSWSVPAVMHFATHGSDKARVDGNKLPPDLSPSKKAECRDVPDDAYFDGRIATAAVSALTELKDKGKPFFLAVGFWKPHSPFNPPKKYWDLYSRSEIDLPSNPEWPEAAPRIAWHNSRELLGNKGRQLTKAEILELRHGYYASISYLDAQVGRVLGQLDRLGLADSTLIVFWSDHGYHLGEHSLWCKTSNFELDARVPLIVVPPAAKHAGRRTDALAELLDLYPTLVDLCGLPVPTGLEGTSLVPVLNDPSRSVKEAAYTQHPRPAYYKGEPQTMGCSVRTEHFRYTEWREWRTGRVVGRELYDHDHDPRETRNVVEDPAHAGAVIRAARLLADQFPTTKHTN